MADNEVSKITWIAIVVALAGSVYGVSKTQIPTLTNTVFDKIGKIVGVGEANRPESPNPDDAKWVEKGNYGTNGYFVRDNAGNGIVYALDPKQPVIAPETAVFTMNNQDLTSLTFLDKTILPKDSHYYFAGNSKLTTFETKNLDTANVTNMSGMFYNMSALTALDVSKFDTSKVTNMSGMFYNTQSLTALDVSNFNTSNVTDVANMFGGRYKDGYELTRPDTSKFNTSKMTNVDQMFDDMLM